MSETGGWRCVYCGDGFATAEARRQHGEQRHRAWWWLHKVLRRVARAWPWGWRHVLRPVWEVATPDGRHLVRVERELDAGLEKSREQMARVQTVLGHAGRVATVDELKQWTGGELLAAEGWAETVIEKRQGVPIQEPPLPVHIARLPAVVAP